MNMAQSNDVVPLHRILQVEAWGGGGGGCTTLQFIISCVFDVDKVQHRHVCVCVCVWKVSVCDRYESMQSLCTVKPRKPILMEALRGNVTMCSECDEGRHRGKRDTSDARLLFSIWVCM